MIKRVLSPSPAQTGNPSGRDKQRGCPHRQGHLSLDQGAQSPVQPDLLNHTRCPCGLVQKGCELLGSRQGKLVIPSQ